jgi:predicted dehydrogenase/threonine dehydrogenase-like Zn-dependent dehydrogenase
MKQIIRRGLREIIVEEVPDPVLVPHHVIIRPVYSLISSGTESAGIHQESVLKEVAEKPSHLQKVWQALKVNGLAATFREVRAKFSEYAVLGYSGAGFLVARHSTVTDLEVGDRVAYGGEGTGHGEYILVGRNLVARVDPSVPFGHACFTTLGSIALNTVRTARFDLGDVVVVLGMGLVGQLVGQLARCQGARVVAADLRPERVELARRLGADYGFLAGDGLAEAVRSVTAGRGADCVVVAAAAKTSAPARQALELCRDRARIVVVGAVALDFPWEEMYRKEIQLLMARAYGPGSYDEQYEKRGQDYPVSYVRWTENRNMEEFLRLLAVGRVRVAELITHEFPLEEAPAAYEKVLDPASGALAVVLRYPPPESGRIPAYSPKTRVEVKPAAPAAGTLGIGLVGAGNLARWVHLPNVKKIAGCALRGICSSNGARAKSYATRFGAAYSCSDYEQLLADPEIHVVVIASRNQHHAAQALAALRAGKHVFVEKPMALTAEECGRICRAVEETGRQLTVGFNRRFAPCYVEFKRQLSQRAGPAVLNMRMNSPGIAGGYWMADPAIGGAILGEACHFADLMFWLLESEPVSVSAYSLPPEQVEPAGTNSVCAAIRFEDGSVANLAYTTAGSRRFSGERVEAFAPGITLLTEDFKKLTVHASWSRTKSRWLPDKGYGAQLEGFFGNLRSGVPPAVTAFDGARATIVCLAILESARTQSPVPVRCRDLPA